MPIGVLSRIPNSVSQGGTCKTNLRGVTPSKPYDFAAPSRPFTVGTALGSSSTEGAGAWSNTIRQAYSSTSSDDSSAITYRSMLSTATTGTLLIRIYIQEFPPEGKPPEFQTVFQNGKTGAGANGYGIFLQTVPVEGESPNYTLFFGRLQDTSDNWVQMSQGSTMNVNEWYQFSLGFAPTGDGTSTVRISRGGSAVIQSTISPEISEPSAGTTELMNFFGRITDFALIEKVFTDAQLAAYGTAPYI